ncbi:MAG: DUF3800 domain-containing protein [Armatimonadota bacterium]|jgi:hypothetical protein|nr:hypothetical protein [Armatimonadota bacterium]
MVIGDCSYVFVDESGDSGFKIEKGSSPIFCIAAVIFQSAEAISATQAVIQQVRSSLKTKQTHEFHFNSESSKFRRTFCEAVRTCPFTVRAIVVDKSLIYEGTMLRKSPSYFYNFTTKMLLKHSFGSIINAKVRIDGRMNRKLKSYLRRELNQESKIICDTKFSDSKIDSMIQLADMIAGSIARSYKPEKKNYQELREMLRPCIEDVWDFGKG